MRATYDTSVETLAAARLLFRLGHWHLLRLTMILLLRSTIYLTWAKNQAILNP